MSELRPGIPKALSDVCVVDMTEGVAGPYASTLLGDMGADVIKIERPEGDWGRTSGNERPGSLSSPFIALNRNKRVLGLDVRRAESRRVMRELLQRADVIISNYRPGVMERLGLGYDECSNTNPSLIYCTISAFGQEGDYASLPGSDTVLQSISGLMDLTGDPDGPPLRVSFTLIDLAAALFAVQGILLALYERKQSDRGRRVEVSLLDASLALQTVPFTEYLIEGKLPERHGNQNPALSPAGAFRTSDGRYVTVAVLRESHWSKFCEALSRPELEKDPRFTDNTRRLCNRMELNEILQPIFERKDQSEWISLLRDADIICAPVNNYEELMSDRGLAEAISLASFPLDGAWVKTVGNPIRMDEEDGGAEIPPPQRGEHTREILSQLSLTREEIDEMFQQEVAFSVR